MALYATGLVRYYTEKTNIYSDTNIQAYKQINKSVETNYFASPKNK